jgi:hypothetical protein
MFCRTVTALSTHQAIIAKKATASEITIYLSGLPGGLIVDKST